MEIVEKKVMKLISNDVPKVFRKKKSITIKIDKIKIKSSKNYKGDQLFWNILYQPEGKWFYKLYKTYDNEDEARLNADLLLAEGQIIIEKYINEVSVPGM